MPALDRSEGREWLEYLERARRIPRSDQTAPFLEHFEGREKLHLLDFGCAHGGWGAAFYRDKEAHGIGNLTVDVADMHLDKAIHLDPAWVGERFHGTFANIRLQPEHYDGIIARLSIMFQSPEGMQDSLDKLGKSLKEGGTLYFTVAQPGFTADDIGVVAMTPAQVREAVTAAGLELESCELDETIALGPARRKLPTYHVYATKPAVKSADI